MIAIFPDILFMLAFARTDTHKKRVDIAKQSTRVSEEQKTKWEAKLAGYKDGKPVSYHIIPSLAHQALKSFIRKF